MKNLVLRLWSDDAGFTVSAELVLIATITVIGLIAGLATVRDQVIQELGDVAIAIGQINQSYSWSAVTGHSSSTAGSFFSDQPDYCDATFGAGTAPACMTLTLQATQE